MRRAARWPSYRLRRFCRGPEEVGRPPEDYIGYSPWRVCRARALFAFALSTGGTRPRPKINCSRRCARRFRHAVALVCQFRRQYPGVPQSPRGMVPQSSRSPGRSEGTGVKIVLRIVGPLFIAVGLFWLVRGTGSLRWPHNLAMVDYGAGVAALGIGLVWFGWQ